MDNLNGTGKKDTTAQVVDFVEKFKSQKELQEYAKVQFKTLLQTNKKIEALEKENASLKEAIKTSAAPAPTAQRVSKSIEESTCELEIAKLHSNATMRELDLNEVRKLEILVKTLHAAQKKSASAEDVPFSNLKDLDSDTLLEIAAQNKED